MKQKALLLLTLRIYSLKFSIVNIENPSPNVKMPTAIQEDFLQEILSDLPKWSKILKIDPRVLGKMTRGEGTIHIKTAQKILNALIEHTWEEKTLEDIFILPELKGYESERKVVYEESQDQFTKDDWISIVRYVIEKRFDALTLLEVLLFLLALGIIGVVVSYFFF